MKRTFILVLIMVTVGLLAGLPAAANGSVGVSHRSLSVNAASSSASLPQSPTTTGFTYQGSLKDGANPANGQHDFQFTLFDALSGGNQVGSTVTILSQTVTNGLFNVTLDFGPTAFQGSARWLQIAVRLSGGGGYTTLSPRQPLTATPYALSLAPGAVITGTVDNNASVLTVNNPLPSGSGYAISAQAHNSVGTIRGVNDSVNGFGIVGSAPNGSGVGTFGSGSDMGVEGYSSAGTAGVYGYSLSSSGVRGYSVTGYAGYFNGNVRITGTCCSMGAGTTQIDHPLDPANKYLNQAAVVSPNMLDIVDGKVTTDANGNATVQLPTYFQALNSDFRYQLTVIGQFAQAIVAGEIKSNSFTIKTDKPNVKVSWQVTGVRHDPYALAHPLQPEQDKPANEKGKYLHPKELGQPESLGVDYDKSKRTPQRP